MTPIANATLRLIARPTISGTAVRIRLANIHGKAPVTIAKVYVGHRIQLAALAAGSNRPVLFKGGSAVTIPAGGDVMSDPVAIEVHAQQDLAVSVYVPGAEVLPSLHGGAMVTSYMTANGAGDATANEVPSGRGLPLTRATPFTGTTTSMPWLEAIDVLSPSAKGAIVAFGDSITDGTCSTTDGHDRWVDWLAVRLDQAGTMTAVLNEGIAGNTVIRNVRPEVTSEPLVERLERDVLSHQGVTHVILFAGTNDLRREASSTQVIGGIEDIVKRVKARGIRIIGATIIPRHNVPPDGTNTGWDDAKSGRRREVNDWIRTRAGFDSVLDFDKVMRDPQNPDRNGSALQCGDGIHPSAFGYYRLGFSIPLDAFGDGGNKNKSAAK